MTKEVEQILEVLRKKINEVEQQYPYKVIGKFDTYDKYSEGWSDACDIISQKIEEVENEHN